MTTTTSPEPTAKLIAPTLVALAAPASGCSPRTISENTTDNDYSDCGQHFDDAFDISDWDLAPRPTRSSRR